MNRTPKSQETKVSQPENAKEEPIVEVDFDANVPGEVETDDTGKNILIRDEDVIDDTSELRLLEDSLPDDSEPEESGDGAGVDPYNSGNFDVSEVRRMKSRAWKARRRSRTRK
ncbi:MAG: hypothetical protein OEU40_05940 [Gammaproteobacteria bacterium]|jgi:hypothetical protein|nr:hypothetical protein [Gammaproteobacteria bacterium]